MVRKGRLNSHGMIVFAAIVLNTLSVLAIMVPSASQILSGASQSMFTIIVAGHSLLGLAVELLGGYIILRWRFQPPGPTCSRMKGLMKVLGVLWTLTVLFGVFVYYLLL